jgi:hypothetical protein
MSRVDEVPEEAAPDEKSLRAMCVSVDAARADYIRRLFNADWLDARHYDLALDTGRFGVDKTVALIEKSLCTGEIEPPLKPVRPSRLPKGLSAFRHYNYRLFWGGMLVSLIGTWMQQLGQAGSSSS